MAWKCPKFLGLGGRTFSFGDWCVGKHFHLPETEEQSGFLAMSKTFVELNRVRLDYPIYNADSRSIKKAIVDKMVGGDIQRSKGVVSVRALRDVSFLLNSGDRLGIVGSNGSGKTTLLRVLAGLYRPTSGDMRISGKIDSLLSIGAGMDMESNAIENIKLRLSILGLGRSEIKHHTPKILEFAELGSFKDLPLRTYSSGMLVRLGFAIATSVRPEILLMDEWLSAGDAEFSRKSQERISAVVGSSEILVIASHNRGTIEKNCNLVLWLENGQTRMLGTPEMVLPAYFGAAGSK